MRTRVLGPLTGVLVFSSRRATAGTPVTLALRRAGQVRLTVTPVAGSRGHPKLVLERAAGDAWQALPAPGLALGDLSGRATAPFDLPAADVVVARTLDLRPPP